MLAHHQCCVFEIDPFSRLYWSEQSTSQKYLNEINLCVCRSCPWPILVHFRNSPGEVVHWWQSPERLSRATPYPRRCKNISMDPADCDTRVMHGSTACPPLRSAKKTGPQGGTIAEPISERCRYRFQVCCSRLDKTRLGSLVTMKNQQLE